MHDAVQGLETPYVVKLSNFFELAESRPVFSFAHPQPLEDSNRSGAFAGDAFVRLKADNRRSAVLYFPISTPSAMLHGFCGTFRARLFGDVDISIEKSTETSGMFSWFPLFIPLAQPVQLKSGDVVIVHIWR